ncbi:MAG TPA: hypothetical protein VGQ30_13700, partial [Gemmatimonadaceae bacterium]|nr:hypothetical protein [Gemmatimonadaceae bacterium]
MIARLVSLYAKIMPVVGTILLFVGAFYDTTWASYSVLFHAVVIVALFGATVSFRRYQLPITKYGTVNLLGIVATGGALVAGPSTTAIALFAGLMFCDTLVLGKTVNVAWINAGRESLALFAAYGFYAWAAVTIDPTKS